MIPWLVTRQVPLSMQFSRPEYWRGLPFPPPGMFPTQGSNSGLLHCRQILYQLSHKRSPYSHGTHANNSLSHASGFLWINHSVRSLCPGDTPSPNSISLMKTNHTIQWNSPVLTVSTSEQHKRHQVLQYLFGGSDGKEFACSGSVQGFHCSDRFCSSLIPLRSPTPWERSFHHPLRCCFPSVCSCPPRPSPGLQFQNTGHVCFPIHTNYCAGIQW